MCLSLYFDSPDIDCVGREWTGQIFLQEWACCPAANFCRACPIAGVVSPEVYGLPGKVCT